MTRIQRERFPDIQEYEKVKGTYTIDVNILQKAKSDVSIMHPMPRMEEISHSMDIQEMLFTSSRQPMERNYESIISF